MGNFFALLSSIGEHIKSTPEKVTPKQLQQLLVRVDVGKFNLIGIIIL